MAKKLIEVEKDGEKIKISPLTLENHKQLGWKMVGGEADAEPEVEPTDEEKAAAEEKKRLAAEKKAAAEAAKKK